MQEYDLDPEDNQARKELRRRDTTVQVTGGRELVNSSLSRRHFSPPYFFDTRPFYMNICEIQ